MKERNIVPEVFTQEMRGEIKLRADFQTRAYIEALETIVYASSRHVNADAEVTRSRVEIMRALARVDLKG